MLDLSVPVSLECFDGVGSDASEAVSRALGRLEVDGTQYMLYHTPLGQPRFRRRRRAPHMGKAGSAAPQTDQPPDGVHPLISFSDEGGIGVAAVVRSRMIVGLGLDILDVRRLDRYRTDATARCRMERRLCAPDEIVQESAVPGIGPGDALAVRFAVKEAVSKALGTGLRLGLGLGSRGGVRPHEITVIPDNHRADIRLNGTAMRRLVHLGAKSVETRWVLKSPHLVALALLQR